MSACNCCEAFPLDVASIEFRTKGVSLSKCGWLLSEQYQSGRIFWASQITRNYNCDGETFTLVEDYIYNASTRLCSYTNNGFSQDITFCNQDTNAAAYFGIVHYVNDYVEYQDSLLISRAEAFLENQTFGDWTASDFPHASKSLRGLGNELYEETATEIRIAHPPTATGYLKVWLQKVSEDYDYPNLVNGVASAFDTYEWTGQPQHLTHPVDHSLNRIVSEPIAIPRPALNKSNRVKIWKYSLLPGYEPEDPTFVDDINWQLLRPDPDCESNGVPTLSADCPFRP